MCLTLYLYVHILYLCSFIPVIVHSNSQKPCPKNKMLRRQSQNLKSQFLICSASTPIFFFRVWNTVNSCAVIPTLHTCQNDSLQAMKGLAKCLLQFYYSTSFACGTCELLKQKRTYWLCSYDITDQREGY